MNDPVESGEPIGPNARDIKLPSHIGKTPLFDMIDLKEDVRITRMGEEAKKRRGRKIAFMVDAGGEYTGTGDRYIKKLLAKYPTIEIIERAAGPSKFLETIIYRMP